MTTLIQELSSLLNEESKPKKVSKKTAKSVYRRDYLKTRNKPYRKYHSDDTKPTQSE